MAGTRTREVAKACVKHLRRELPGVQPRGVRSVFVNGSYVRGDWLDGRSDLDIGLVTESSWESGFAEIKRLASKATAGAVFAAHVDGGVDWNLIDRAALPRTTRQAVDSPYPYFNVFRFDLDAHCQVLWGEDFREWLPPVPPSGDPCAGVPGEGAVRLCHRRLCARQRRRGRVRGVLQESDRRMRESATSVQCLTTLRRRSRSETRTGERLPWRSGPRR